MLKGNLAMKTISKNSKGFRLTFFPPDSARFPPGFTDRVPSRRVPPGSAERTSAVLVKK